VLQDPDGNPLPNKLLQIHVNGRYRPDVKTDNDGKSAISFRLGDQIQVEGYIEAYAILSYSYSITANSPCDQIIKLSRKPFLIRGDVFEKGSHVGLQYVAVTLKGRSVTITTKTDENGRYYIYGFFKEDLPGSLEFNKDGYEYRPPLEFADSIYTAHNNDKDHDTVDVVITNIYLKKKPEEIPTKIKTGQFGISLEAAFAVGDAADASAAMDFPLGTGLGAVITYHHNIIDSSFAFLLSSGFLQWNSESVINHSDITISNKLSAVPVQTGIVWNYDSHFWAGLTVGIYIINKFGPVIYPGSDPSFAWPNSYGYETKTPFSYSPSVGYKKVIRNKNIVTLSVSYCEIAYPNQSIKFWGLGLGYYWPINKLLYKK